MMSHGRHEFDDLIEIYRKAQGRAIAISGETEDYFATLRARLLQIWLPEFMGHPISILDFGSSDGHMAAIVKKQFPESRVSGIDTSSRSIEYARRSHSDLEFFDFQGGRMPFQDATFDLAYAVGVLHHIPFQEHEATYHEIFRVIKPGGAFVLFEMNPWNPVTQLVFRMSAVDRHATMFSSRYASKLLRKFGLVDIRYYAYFPRLLKFLRPFEPRLEKIPFGTLYAIIVRP
jgi:ubiquinone/menaquinone biosynthesis C-methylase UbiE